MLGIEFRSTSEAVGHSTSLTTIKLDNINKQQTMTKENVADIHSNMDSLKVLIWKELTELKTKEFKSSSESMKAIVRIGELAEGWLHLQEASSNLMQLLRD